jgi:hypothetical protein
VQKRGGQIEVVYVEDMAHNAFFGPLVRRTATWGNGQTLGASLGATDEARAEFFKAMVNFIERHKLVESSFASTSDSRGPYSL